MAGRVPFPKSLFLWGGSPPLNSDSVSASCFPLLRYHFSMPRRSLMHSDKADTSRVKMLFYEDVVIVVFLCRHLPGKGLPVEQTTPALIKSTITVANFRNSARCFSVHVHPKRVHQRKKASSEQYNIGWNLTRKFISQAAPQLILVVLWNQVR